MSIRSNGHVFIVLLLCLALGHAFAAEQQLECQAKIGKIQLSIEEDGLDASLTRVGDSEAVEADDCSLAEDLDETVMTYIPKKLRKDIFGICIFVTGDDGSADMVVVTSKRGKKEFYSTFADLSIDRAGEATALSCQ